MISVSVSVITSGSNMDQIFWRLNINSDLTKWSTNYIRDFFQPKLDKKMSIS